MKKYIKAFYAKAFLPDIAPFILLYHNSQKK